jgi:hypothetical protein
LLQYAHQHCGPYFPPFTLSVFLSGFVLRLVAVELYPHCDVSRDESNHYKLGLGLSKPPCLFSFMRANRWCALDSAGNVDPSILLEVLLPPVVFASASRTDFYIFRRSIDSIFMLGTDS